MKFVILSSSNPMATSRGMKHGLEQLGHQVSMFTIHNHRFYPDQLIRAGNECDSLIVCKGTQIRNIKQYQEVISRLPDVTYFIPDVVDRGQRSAAVGPRAMVCTRIVCTGLEAAKWFRTNGYTRRIAQVYQGYRKHVWYPEAKPRNQSNTLVFLGSFYRDDGGRSKKISRIQKLGYPVLVRDNLFERDASMAYWNHAVCLNFSAWDCTSNRLMRILASGGFCLTEKNKDLAHSFENENQLVWFESTEEMLDKVSTYMKDSTAREEIAARGLEWAKTRDWTAQMNKIVRFINGEIVCDGAAGTYVS